MGQIATVQTPSFSTGQLYETKDMIGEHTFTVEHNPDGTKSGDISANIPEFNVQYSSLYIKTLECGGNATFDTIPRATTPTLSASSIDMGQSLTISTSSRASESFTHTLKYVFGNASGVIGTEIATSKSWTVPLVLAEQIPNSVEGECSIVCETYNGSVLIGTKNITVKIKVPSSDIPTIDSVLITDPMNYESWHDGNWIQNKSSLKVEVEASGISGSSVSRIDIEALGNVSQNPFTSNVITESGEKTITITVTDSRGRVASTTRSITVLQYKSPLISELTWIRCDAYGTPNDEGGFIHIHWIASATDVIRNLAYYEFNYKSQDSTEWEYHQDTISKWVSNHGFIFAADVNKTYEGVLTVRDDFATVTKSIEMSTAYTLMDFNESGKGVAFGKVSEKDAMEINMDIEFKKSVTGINWLDQVKVMRVSGYTSGNAVISVGLSYPNIILAVKPIQAYEMYPIMWNNGTWWVKVFQLSATVTTKPSTAVEFDVYYI